MIFNPNFIDYEMLNHSARRNELCNKLEIFFRFLKRRFRHSHQNGIWNISKQAQRQEWMLIKSFMIWWKKFTSKRKRLPQNKFRQNLSRIVVWKSHFRLFGNSCKEIVEHDLEQYWWFSCHVLRLIEFKKLALLYLP